MSKKKKIFKQKIRQMLQEAEKGIVSQIPKEEFVKPAGSQEVPEKEIKSEPPKTVVAPNIAIAPIEIVKRDLRKIATTFLIIIVIIIGVAIVAERTNFISIVADKLYNWAQLGS